MSAYASSRGFALVVTMALVVLLAAVAVGLLSLSSISLRNSRQSLAQAEAQANARMALMIAIGELQRLTGPDIRITAPADILDPGNPPLTGVWKSWEGSDHLATGPLAGRPVKPDYASKLRNATENNGRFLAWLVCAEKPGLGPNDAASLVKRIAGDTTIPLVSAGSLAAADDRQVHVQPVLLERGAYAWWVSGENQKVHLPRPHELDADSPPAWADLNRTHAVADPAVFELESLLADPLPARKSFTRNTADLFAKPDAAARPSQSFHDLSAVSVGLLTNTATGGWRKDFSLLTENWDSQPSSGLEFFKISPSIHLQYTRPANLSDYQPAKSMLYHWSDYRASHLREFWARRGPIASWAKIKSYATLYKSMSPSSKRAPNINHQSWVDNGTAENAHETFHNVRILPQMARLQIVVSHFATTSGAAPGKYRPAVLYSPYVTVWNPYNTRVTLNGRLIFSASYTWPLALKHKISGAALPDEYWAVQAGSATDDYRVKCLSKAGGWFHDMVFYLNENPMVLEPGETRIFSPAESYLRDVTGTNRISTNLSPGVRTGVGYYFTLDRRFDLNNPPDPMKVSFAGSSKMEVDAKFDVASLNWGGRNRVCGWAYQWFINSFGSGRSHSWYQVFYDADDADTLYPPKLGLASASLAECAGRPVPFLSMTLGSRIANFKAIATKGMVQADPVVDFFASNGAPRFTDVYPGNDTLINTPWDFSVVEHPSLADDMLPNVDNATQSSYIVTGVRKADGVSRIVAAELPTRPLASIADLTHLPVRGLNPTPPYSGNIIANSDASPLIAADSIVNPANIRANSRSNEQQDDSYCSNHILFDDWFFSSIAPKPAGFGPSGGTDLRQTYLDFLTGKDSLINRAYRPIAQDRVADAARAGAKYTQYIQPANSWKTVASRLEVEGMFNVNSTSIKAWRALLGHARDQKIPYSRPDGTIGLSNFTNYAISRTNVAGDRAAGEAPQVAGEYADTTEFTGHRVFTADMLDALAENVVEQVRVRGPFLSLSEFVNRQLSTDNKLALAGAIQTALNQLTADGSLNPFHNIQNESVASLADPPGPDGYVLREAAVGHNTYGLPGWTRQADVLRPLAPILTVRDDTFTIRAYGDARSTDGKVIARAWCEAIVQRIRDFPDSSDAPDITTQPSARANQIFGRQFKLLSFRWLNPNEV